MRRHPARSLLLIKEIPFKSRQREGAAIYAKSSTCWITLLWGLWAITHGASLETSALDDLWLLRLSLAPAIVWGWAAVAVASLSIARLVVRARSSIHGIFLYGVMSTLWSSVCLQAWFTPASSPADIALSTGAAVTATWAVCTSFYRRGA